jgi:midasin
MGDTEGGDVVDERLWEDGDEKEEGQGEETRDNNKTAQVKDKSELEYDAGGEEEDDDSKTTDDKKQDQADDKQAEQEKGSRAAAGRTQRPTYPKPPFVATY